MVFKQARKDTKQLENLCGAVVEKEMIEQDFEAICKANKYRINDMHSRRRESHIVDQRRAVARKLRDKGYTYPAIGKVMHKDHTAIMYMVNDQHRDEKKFKMREYQRLRKGSNNG